MHKKIAFILQFSLFIFSIIINLNNFSLAGGIEENYKNYSVSKVYCKFDINYQYILINDTIYKTYKRKNRDVIVIKSDLPIDITAARVRKIF